MLSPLRLGMLCGYHFGRRFLMHFICPLCQQPLLPNAQGLACAKQHQFDRAKEGYFNLLPAHHKNSREPGDAKEQLQARRQFLAAGHFAPLLASLCELIPAATKTLLDIGCGEGYFTHAIQQHLSDSAAVYGIDIAKSGVKLAAKRYAGSYTVASSFSLPLADKSMEVITRIYAPSSDEELQRVLAEDGRLIIVTPAAGHLLCLRELIYEQVRQHPQPQAPAGFRLQETKRLSFNLSIAPGDMSKALLQMTPFAWRLTPQLATELIGRGIEDQADFYLSVYVRH